MAKKPEHHEGPHKHAEERMPITLAPATPAPPNSYQRELERQIEDLQEQLMRKQSLLQLVMDNQAVAEELIKQYRSN